MCPAVPASRPIMESSANWYRRVMRSPAVMAALVGGPEYLRGRGACAASPAGTRASAPNMANDRNDITRSLFGGRDGATNAEESYAAHPLHVASPAPRVS